MLKSLFYVFYPNKKHKKRPLHKESNSYGPTTRNGFIKTSHLYKKILDFVPSNEKKVFFSSQKCFLFSGPPILRLEILRSSYLSIPAEGGRGWIIIAFLSLDLKFHLLARREVRKSCKKVSLKENQVKKVFLE
jgi:hypothetical protein